MSSLPIRIRLTLPFAVAMALVLVALGVFVYLRVGTTLLATVDQGLRAQTTAALARAADKRPLLDRDALGRGTIAEVLGPNGAILESSATGLPRLLDLNTEHAAASRPLSVNRSVKGLEEKWRLRAVPAGAGRVLVVGSSLESREEALDGLRREFVFSAPLALVLATLAGYMLAGAALRPVEAMRRRAAAITATTPGARLPVPQARDEISRLAETINAMLGRLEAAFEHERRFVSDASHELRTPLALLRTELDLALRRTRTREELEQALRSAAEETDRLTSLAEELLLVARADQAELPVHLEPISTRELFDRVVRRFSVRASELGRPLRVIGDDADVEADPARLEQAIGNLVANALVHGAGSVELSARRSNGHVELHVTDEGRGFPRAFAPRAFDRFSRADDARSIGGSGLGLAIAEAIASAHGGSASVGNSPGGGADVWISL